MSLDATAAQTAILGRLATLCGGRILDTIPEEEELIRDATTGLVLPYILVTFGALYPTEDDRSIEGEAQQPHIMPMVFECWSSVMSVSRKVAGSVRTRIVGWSPDDDDATEIALRGGGWFQQRDSSGRPTLAMESVTASTIVNQSIPSV